jgi:hypothetical protein
LLEADFGLQSFRHPARTREHIGAEQQFFAQGVPNSKINLNQENNVGPVGGKNFSSTDAKEHARRAAVTFEFALIFAFLV